MKHNILLAQPYSFVDYLLKNQKHFPTFKAMANFEHEKMYHPEGNVQEHTIEAIKCIPDGFPLTTLCAFAHDYGKVDTYSFDGKHRYFQHHKEGTQRVIDEFKQFYLTEEELAIIIFVKENHMRFHELPNMRKTKVQSLCEHKYFLYLYMTAKADSECRGCPLHTKDTWHEYSEIVKTWIPKIRF